MTAVGVGLIGLGTVGSAVARRLVGEWELLDRRAGATPVLRRVAVRDSTRTRQVELPRIQLDSDADALIDDEAVAIVVEVMGGVDRASALIERALRAGKPVVTANKAALAAHGVELATLAAEAVRPNLAGMATCCMIVFTVPGSSPPRTSLRAQKFRRS